MSNPDADNSGEETTPISGATRSTEDVGAATAQPELAEAGKPGVLGRAAKSDVTAPAKSRKRWFIIGGTVIIVSLAIWGAVWYFTSSKTTDDPRAAVTLYMKSIKERDADQAEAVLCKEFTQGKKLKVSDQYSFSKFDYTVGAPRKISATKYLVRIDVDAIVSNNGESTKQKNTKEYPVVKQDGDWKVCPQATKNS